MANPNPNPNLTLTLNYYIVAGSYPLHIVRLCENLRIKPQKRIKNGKKTETKTQSVFQTFIGGKFSNFTKSKGYEPAMTMKVRVRVRVMAIRNPNPLF